MSGTRIYLFLINGGNMPVVWKKIEENYPSPVDDIKCEAAVIGGGMTGVITAYLLSKKGLDTVLLEENRIASGKTGRSTAKATLAHGLIYSALSEKCSPETAKKYAAANIAGLKFIGEHTPTSERRDMYLYALYGKRRVMREYKQMLECGINCEYVPGESCPMPFHCDGAIRLPDQYELDPVKFCLDLCREGRFRIYENTPVTHIGRNHVTAGGHIIECDTVSAATNYPAFPGTAAALKISRKSSCVAAFTSETGFRFPEIMAFGADGGYGYRLARDSFGTEYLIVSGETHRGAPPVNAIERMKNAVWEFAPDALMREAWVNNDSYTHDSVPYAGKLRNGIYMACGYSAWGMTNSAACAVILAEQICGGGVWYDDVFSPHRSFLSGGSGDFAEHMSEAISGNIKRMSAPPDLYPSEVSAGCGEIINYRGTRKGAYRDRDGRLHIVEGKCPHLGCALEWNDVDLTWDCPCHGSRFSYTGECISNPAHRGIRIE